MNNRRRSLLRYPTLQLMRPNNQTLAQNQFHPSDLRQQTLRCRPPQTRLSPQMWHPRAHLGQFPLLTPAGQPTKTPPPSFPPNRPQDLSLLYHHLRQFNNPPPYCPNPAHHLRNPRYPPLQLWLWDLQIKMRLLPPLP